MPLHISIRLIGYYKAGHNTLCYSLSVMSWDAIVYILYINDMAVCLYLYGHKNGNS